MSGRGRKEGGRIVAPTTSASWQVEWHPGALEENKVIAETTERVAIAHVIEKLRVDGPTLRSPHQSAVMGEEGAGLRELRPRRGRSRWRPIYRRVGEERFVILAVGPEAEIDKAGYRRAVRAAKSRLEALEKEDVRK